MWLVAAMLGAAGGLLTLVITDELVSASMAQLVGATPREAESIARAATVIRVVLSLVLITLLVPMAFLLRSGRHWSRIVLGTVGAVWIAGTLLGIGEPFSVGGPGILIGLLNLVTIALIVAASVFMFAADTHRFLMDARPRR